MKECWEIVLEYLKVLITWPFAVIFIAVLCITNFKEAISFWLRSLKIQHGDTVISSQYVHNKFENEKNKAEEKLIEQTQPKNEEVVNGADALNWRANAYIWEYRYLNYYLILQTHLVLDWIYDLKTAIAFSFFDTSFKVTIPLAEERMAIITALSNHYLVSFEGSKIEITEKGREYIEYMGRAEKRNMISNY